MIAGARLCDMARERGFALAGVTPAAPSAHEEPLRAWLAAGKHGEMGWLENHIEQRVDPAVMVPGAKSVLLVGDLIVVQAEKGHVVLVEATPEKFRVRGKCEALTSKTPEAAGPARRTRCCTRT